MSIVCSVDYQTAQKYKGKTLSTKYNNKKHRVYLKLHADDATLAECVELAKQSKNILMVSYQGTGSWEQYDWLSNLRGVYVGYPLDDFGVDVSEDDILRAVDGIPSSITPIICLPKSFTDIEFLWRVSKKCPRLRFSGGTLFAIDGIKVGEIGIDILERENAKFGVDSYRLRSGVDVLEDVNISQIEIDTSGKAESTSTQRKPKSTSAPKKTENIKSRIGALFLNSEFGGL